MKKISRFASGRKCVRKRRQEAAEGELCECQNQKETFQSQGIEGGKSRGRELQLWRQSTYFGKNLVLEFIISFEYEGHCPSQFFLMQYRSSEFILSCVNL